MRFTWFIPFLLLLSFTTIAVDEVLTAATPLTVSILTDKDSGIAPLEIHFQANSSTISAETVSYSWDFEDDGIIDSTEPSPAHAYSQEGSFTARVTITTATNETATATQSIVVTAPKPQITITLKANPAGGVAPLGVQFIAAAVGKEPLSYSWYFQADGTVDSTSPSPSFTFDNAGVYNVTLTVTDASGNSFQKIESITVTAFDSKLELSSYFPDEVKKGENKITVIIKNGGEKILTDITARIVGTGVQHMSSTTIPALQPGEEDSLTLTVNVVLKTKLGEATLKVLDKTFPVNLTVVKEIEYNQEELETQFNLLKEKLQEQENIFSSKNAEKYLVSEIYESGIKPTKKQMQDVQGQLLTGKLADAKVNLDLLSTAINDITQSLAQAQKLKVSKLQWFKDNISTISAIIIAFGVVGGAIAAWAKKAKTGAEKLTETVKQKLVAKKNGTHSPEQKAEHHPEQHAEHQPPEEPKAEGKEEAPQVKKKVSKKKRKKKEGEGLPTSESSPQ